MVDHPQLDTLFLLFSHPSSWLELQQCFIRLNTELKYCAVYAAKITSIRSLLYIIIIVSGQLNTCSVFINIIDCRLICYPFFWQLGYFFPFGNLMAAAASVMNFFAHIYSQYVIPSQQYYISTTAYNDNLITSQGRGVHSYILM